MYYNKLLRFSYLKVNFLKPKITFVPVSIFKLFEISAKADKHWTFSKPGLIAGSFLLK